ncbi:hypothetical protein C8J56DRAFT_1045771 [Mycena floridula]|nr:hypothetical protein C8J56DRAFT_1045771 [Mycena floridula]
MAPQPVPLTLIFVYLSAQCIAFIVVGSPATASLLFYALWHTTLTSATKFLITFGLTWAAIGTVLLSVRFRIVSNQCYHSVILAVIWSMAALEALPFDIDSVFTELILVFPALSTVLLVVAGLLVRFVHVRFGFPDTQNDWKEAFEVMSDTMKLWLFCGIRIQENKFDRSAFHGREAHHLL